jgi:ribosome-binding factor A
MAGYKLSRLSEDVYREISSMMRELKDPRIDPLLSVVHVDLTNDLSYCTVYVSSLDGKERAKESVRGLNSAKGWLRRELFRRVKMRKCPDLIFKADDSIEYGAYIEKKIHDINASGGEEKPSDKDGEGDE